MLAIGSRFAPTYWASLISDLCPGKSDLLAIAFHSQLLEIGWKSFQVLFVGKDCDSLCVEKIVIPDRQKPHQYRKVSIKRSRAKVFVHLVKTVKERMEVIRAYGNHC